MSLYQALVRERALGLPVPATLLVKAYLDECGPTPVGLLAKYLAVCERTVLRSLAQLKALGISYGEMKSIAYDHAIHGSNHVGTPTAPSAAGPEIQTVVTCPQIPTDPLQQQLLAFGVLPWCVDALVARVDRTVLERQLTFHQARLDAGFKFTGHPARYLFRACLNDYLPPADFHAKRQMTAEPAKPRRERVAFEPVVEDAQTAITTLEQAKTAVRWGLRSKIPGLRAEALRLAEHWGIDTNLFAC